MALLQEDGIFSSNSFMIYKGGLPRKMLDFTLCARLNINYLRGPNNYWLSIGNETHDNLLIGAFMSDSKGSRIIVKRYHPDIEDDVAIRFDKGFDFQAWHHFCFVFSSFPEGKFNI